VIMPLPTQPTPGSGTAGFNASYAAKADLQYVFQLHFTFFSESIENGRLPSAVHEHLH